MQPIDFPLSNFVWNSWGPMLWKKRHRNKVVFRKIKSGALGRSPTWKLSMSELWPRVGANWDPVLQSAVGNLVEAWKPNKLSKCNTKTPNKYQWNLILDHLGSFLLLPRPQCQNGRPRPHVTTRRKRSNTFNHRRGPARYEEPCIHTEPPKRK